MRHDSFDDKDMMPADRDHPWSRVRGLELEPVGCEPELADVLAKDLESRAAAAERGARTAFGMVDDPGLYRFDRGRAERKGVPPVFGSRQSGFGPFDVVTPNPVGLLLCCISALAFATVAALIALWLYTPGRGNPATVHGALDNAWCVDFRHALSCPNAQANARD